MSCIGETPDLLILLRLVKGNWNAKCASRKNPLKFKQKGIKAWIWLRLFENPSLKDWMVLILLLQFVSILCVCVRVCPQLLSACVNWSAPWLITTQLHSQSVYSTCVHTTWKMTFNERCHSMEDGLQWKTNFDCGWPLMKEILQWKIP